MSHSCSIPWLSTLLSVDCLFYVLCVTAQPAGAPEVSKKSLDEGSVKGGEELFIIGKNFMKGTTVVFEEHQGDKVVWSKEADVDSDFFQAVS